MKVKVYDPYLKEKSTTDNLEDAISDAVAIIIATGHNEFKKSTQKNC